MGIEVGHKPANRDQIKCQIKCYGLRGTALTIELDLVYLHDCSGVNYYENVFIHWRDDRVYREIYRFIDIDYLFLQ